MTSTLQLQCSTTRCVVVVVLILLVVSSVSRAIVVDIDDEIYTIVSRHNSERRAVRDAADMKEIRWDNRLARQASTISEICRYERPSLMDENANLVYIKGHVYGWRAVRDLVTSALDHWSSGRDRFSYSTHCGRACSYITMIHSCADRIGCALSVCDNLDNGHFVEEYATLMVCIYSPGENLVDSVPYLKGQPCSQCATDSICYDGLCSIQGLQRPLPSKSDKPITNAREVQDELTYEETESILRAHNALRETVSLTRVREPLEWDLHLERWAKYIIDCNIDYPGPEYTYTNFLRVDQGDDVGAAVHHWSLEGRRAYLKMFHKCRTPNYDLSNCNHFTNLLQPELTSMACAARDCGDSSRQLVCLYDNCNSRSFLSADTDSGANVYNGWSPLWNKRSRNDLRENPWTDHKVRSHGRKQSQRRIPEQPKRAQSQRRIPERSGWEQSQRRIPERSGWEQSQRRIPEQPKRAQSQRRIPERSGWEQSQRRIPEQPNREQIQRRIQERSGWKQSQRRIRHRLRPRVRNRKINKKKIMNKIK